MVCYVVLMNESAVSLSLIKGHTRALVQIYEQTWPSPKMTIKAIFRLKHFINLTMDEVQF